MEIGKIKLGNTHSTITDSFVNFNRLFLDNFTKLAILALFNKYDTVLNSLTLVK